MDREDKEYHCEDCKKFNETDVPAECSAGHGKVAFRHRVCSDFILKFHAANSNEN
jgi:hypothetical protein